ncbi:MAG: ABC transporter permease [Faecalibacterium sp.]|nr:ABC transporter permease [Ruminococcus sp.]MCM1392930.1 ABC transporter permease [Ruminococcus sp.]MCM1485380.1 ABC transporter permease [Faecalibacterium sp.]
MTAFFNALPGAIAQGIVWGIMAIGVYITYKVLDIADLTVDGSMATGGAVFVVLTTSGQNIYLSLLVAFIAGCLAGLMTGIFHTAFGIPAILAGILTQLALYSINLRIMKQNSNLAINFRKYNLLLTLSNIPKSLIVGCVIVLIIVAILYWFFGTQYGASVRATGCNIAMARANGINTNFNKIFGLVLSNGIVALSGALLSQYNGFADINSARGAIVIGLAAVIIGEVIFGKIFRNFALSLISIVIGSVIYYIVQTLVIQIGLNANDLKMFSAFVVAIFLGAPYWKEKTKNKISRNKKSEPVAATVGGDK